MDKESANSPRVKRAVHEEFLFFSGVGGVATFAQYGALITLVQLLGIEPVPASAIGFILGGIVSYYLNHKITFRSDKQHSEAVGKFIIVATVGIILNVGVMSLGTELLLLHYLFAQVIATGVVLVWNFVCNRLWTFA